MNGSNGDSGNGLGQTTASSRIDLAQGIQPQRIGGLARINVPPEIIRLLPSEFVKRHRVLPLQVQNGALHVATAEPGNQRVIDDIRLLSGLEVQEFEAPAGEITEKIAECYQVTVEQMVENLSPSQGATIEARNLHDIEVMANEPTVINL